MKQPLEKYWPEMSRVVERRVKGIERPIPTPWPHLNKILSGGFWPGLHPIISSPGNGKTTFAVQIAACAASAGFETYYASLELDETQIVLRIASALHGDLSWKDLLLGNNRQQSELDSLYADRVKGLPLVLDTGNPEGWRIEEIEQWLKETNPNQTRLVVVDYLQLASSGDGEDVSSRVSYITKRLQDIARLNNTAIVAISSTSRSNYDERRLFEDSEVLGTAQGNTGKMGNRAPVNRMAKESGDIEYGATSLSALVRMGNRTYLLISKRRLDEGGVWCSFTFSSSGFQVDTAAHGPLEAPLRERAQLHERHWVEAFVNALQPEGQIGRVMTDEEFYGDVRNRV